MNRQHDDDCASNRGFECDCDASRISCVQVTIEMLLAEKKMGSEVIAKSNRKLRYGDKAKIVGLCDVWNKLCYTIQFEDGSLDAIPIDEKLMREAGYEFS